MQKTAYEMRISDWSSDVCSSDLDSPRPAAAGASVRAAGAQAQAPRSGGGGTDFVARKQTDSAAPQPSAGALTAHDSDRSARRRPGLQSEERRERQEGVSTCSSR